VVEKGDKEVHSGGIEGGVRVEFDMNGNKQGRPGRESKNINK
jgi:hypothetical protein